MTIKQQMMFVAMGIMLLSYLFYSELIAPQCERIRELEIQRDRDLISLKLVDNFSLQHPQLDTYLAELDQQVAQMNALLPSDSDVSAFVIQLQQAAQERQLDILHITPGTYLSNVGYYEIPVEVEVRGNFFKVIEFIQRCESLARFTTIAAVNIQEKQGLLECKIPLVIYTFGPVPVQDGAVLHQPKSVVTSRQQ